VAERVLVAYITAGGATRDYANVVARTLEEHGNDVVVADLKKERVSDLAEYATVVVGLGVRMGMLYRKGKRFLARKDLAGKPLAIFLSSAIAIEDASKSREKFLTPLVKKLGLAPVQYDAFPGKLPGPAGKVENTTDLSVAAAWAERLANAMERSE
jgi:menaquinone-dependent protoporphyrinogen IX oxidase